MKTPRTPEIPALERFWWKHELGIQLFGILVLVCSAIAGFAAH